MIFRQLFDPVSSTYTYLIGSRRGGEALIIDPVLDRVDRYLQLIRELELELVKAIDTHVHADHVSGLPALRDRTLCVTVMGAESGVDVVSMRVAEGDRVEIEGGVALDPIYTPGHTSESYSFLMGDRVFTGDTLLIRGTGRTDFQNGDPRAQYESLFGKLLRLPEQTLVYPAHDYKGDTVSTIGEEKRCNPRLQVRSVDEYVEIMSNLKLDNPKMMDVAIPANLKLGMAQDAIDAEGWSVGADDLLRSIESGDAPLLVDLRERGERARRGVIPGSVHAPYGDTAENVRPGGLLFELARSSRRPLVFYCAFGERSAMALEMARQAGIEDARHLKGGLDAWRAAGGEIETEA
ncbi:MAG TPA: MBL fold metallo-hydrolase [Thermoanaerobaculia bacterium]|nr:MBL fold metallo-hydrolase [Thermoanaerobaculia bacterium]